MNRLSRRQSIVCKVLLPCFLYVELFAFFILFNPLSVYPQDTAAPTPKPVTAYNRSTDETAVGISIVLESRPVGIPSTEIQESLTFAAGFRYKGQQHVAQAATVTLALQSQALLQRFAEGLNLIGVINGARVEFGTLSYAHKEWGATRIETLRVDVPAHTFLKLAHGHTVKLLVGSKEMILSPTARSALAALAEQLNGGAITATELHQGLTNKARPPQASQPGRMTLDTTQLENTHVAPPPAHSCPIQVQQLGPLRGFRLGQSLSEVMNRFQSSPPAIPRPDALGIRTLRLPVAKTPDARGTTRLTAVELGFFNERLYRIEMTYLIGKEWKGRQMSEFANSISRELGVISPWAIGTNNNFELNCGAARLTLSVDEDSFIDMPTGRRESIAVAYFTLADMVAAAELKQRHIDVQQRLRQRDAQQRRIFKP